MNVHSGSGYWDAAVRHARVAVDGNWGRHDIGILLRSFSMAKAKKKPTNTVPKARCGLCGKSRNLTKTECCDNWICDDEDKYVMFSYARNSCHRNHNHYTLCAHHHNEEHDGEWKTCAKCRSSFARKIRSGMEPTSITSQKLPIRRLMSRQNAPSARQS